MNDELRKIIEKNPRESTSLEKMIQYCSRVGDIRILTDESAGEYAAMVQTVQDALVLKKTLEMIRDVIDGAIGSPAGGKWPKMMTCAFCNLSAEFIGIPPGSDSSGGVPLCAVHAKMAEADHGWDVSPVLVQVVPEEILKDLQERDPREGDDRGIEAQPES